MHKERIWLVQLLQMEGILFSPTSIRAFEKIDRRDFVPDTELSFAYENIPLPIGYGQTISAPSVVAFMLELLNVHEGDIVLDIGSGSGWTTALLAEMIGSAGYVTGLEIIPELVESGNRNLRKYAFLHSVILRAKKDILGIPGNSFDRILVSASASRFPSELLAQLRPMGSLVIPIGTSLVLYKKDAYENVFYREFPGFFFVPLQEPTQRWE